MQGRSNARSARGESDSYQVLSLKLYRSVFESVSRQARRVPKEPSVFVRGLLEAEVAQPPHPLQSGYAIGELIAVPVRVRRSTVRRLEKRASQAGLKASQLARAVLEDHVLRSAQTRPTGIVHPTPFRRAG